MIMRIDMIEKYVIGRTLYPKRFRYNKESEPIIIDRVIRESIENKNGNRYILYACESVIDNVKKQYEIRLDIDIFVWTLKI